MTEPTVAIFELHAVNPSLLHGVLELIRTNFDIEVHVTTDLTYHVVLYDRAARAKWGGY